MIQLIKTFFLALLTGFILMSTYACAPFRDSPFSDKLLRSERDLNTESLAKISNIEADSKIRIAIFTDSHQNYKDLDKIIYNINQTVELDFVVNLGDITNSAYNIEYDQFLDSYVNIIPPTLTIPGNHDMIGSGPTLFQKIFGPYNFWFESEQYRFIFFHSINLEDPAGFKPSWLWDAVNSSVKKVIIFSHIKLNDPERFFGDNEKLFTNVIQHPLVQIIFNGHNHIFNLETIFTTVLLQAPRTEGLNWLIIEIESNKLKVIRQPSGDTILVDLKP